MEVTVSHHSLQLDHVGPGWRPACTCGWVGLPRTRHVAASEYRAHRAHVERRRVESNVIAPRPVTATADLPELLRAPHPDIRPFVEAVDAVVSRLRGD